MTIPLVQSLTAPLLRRNQTEVVFLSPWGDYAAGQRAWCYRRVADDLVRLGVAREVEA